MARLALAVAATALAALASAEQCSSYVQNPNNCPGLGGVCNGNILCTVFKGQNAFCAATAQGSNGAYQGTCNIGPPLQEVRARRHTGDGAVACCHVGGGRHDSLSHPSLPPHPQIYAKACAMSTATADCMYQDPLALTPRSPPSSLQCVKANPGDTDGTCRLQPNRHGDACNVNAECASGNCLKEIRLCKGFDDGQECVPGLNPDTCMAGRYCAPSTRSSRGGLCTVAVAPGKTCLYSNACQLGTFCAGSGGGNTACSPPFTVPAGANTTVGPFMCVSGAAVLVSSPTSTGPAVYNCLGNGTGALIGTPCDSFSAPPPPGYTCTCAADGQNRVAAVNYLGGGERTAVWTSLYNCLTASTNVMGAPCEFDASDMMGVRYGSCAYYSCYPHYQKLVNATGMRYLLPPAVQFEPFAPCEMAASAAYYASVNSAPCIRIPNLENWHCAVLSVRVCGVCGGCTGWSAWVGVTSPSPLSRRPLR